MTCRCRTPEEHHQRAMAQARESRESESRALKKKIAELTVATPDNTKFQIVEVQEVGQCLVLKVLYPNCAKCSYEGNKVMVFSGVGLREAILWREIDPHFRDPAAQALPHQAPGPVARFPASPDGWHSALVFAAWLTDNTRTVTSPRRRD